MYQKRPTQEDRILQLLEERGEAGAYVYEFMAPRPNGLGIAQYNARVYGLRKRGFDIINKSPGHFVLRKVVQAKMEDLRTFDELINGGIHEDTEMALEELDTVVQRLQDNEVDDILMEDDDCVVCDALRMERAGVYCEKHQRAFCPKCGEVVLGDTDGLCVSCV
jgi:hypothetical protein